MRDKVLEFESRLQSIERTIKEGLSHPKASAQTVAMYGELKDEVKEIRHVLFGNKSQGEMGMVEKVDEMHTILVQARGAGNGARSLLQWIVLIGASISAVAFIKNHWYK